MKTIRGKLLVYFFVFVLLFQITAVSIFVSSNGLMNTYHDSFERFLLLNAISQESDHLYRSMSTYVKEPNTDNFQKYFQVRQQVINEKNQLADTFYTIDRIEMKNYLNLIETLLTETEMTVGFVILDDMELYSYRIEEARRASEFIQEATLELINIELTSYQDFYRDLQDRNESFFLFILFLFVTTIMLAVFFALWFSKGITTPVKKLSRAANEVAAGNLVGEPVQIESNDELKLLGDTFNNMRTDIHELVKEIQDQSELDRLVKEMELKQLQNQINPHFLFNTLNTLSKMAYLENAKVTSNLIDSVATLLRHSLGDINKSVTLGMEVEVVKDYFQIQKTRFSERVTFEMDIDDACLDVHIPRLTLQPLVENAFIHGIEEREEGGHIWLRVYPQPAEIVVEVTDDGAGMRPERMEKILSLADAKEAHVGHSTGIGLHNVIRRLQLFYQTQHIVELESELGEGTTIRLLLPRK